MDIDYKGQIESIKAMAKLMLNVELMHMGGNHGLLEAERFLRDHGVDKKWSDEALQQAVRELATESAQAEQARREQQMHGDFMCMPESRREHLMRVFEQDVHTAFGLYPRRLIVGKSLGPIMCHRGYLNLEDTFPPMLPPIDSISGVNLGGADGMLEL